MEEELNVDVTSSDAAEPVQPVVEPVIPDTPPVQVVSVEELIERLTEATDAAPVAEEEQGEPEEEEPSLADQFFTSALDDTSSAEIVQLLTEIRASVSEHPLLTTDFADYTVTEGLLLALLLCLIVNFCIKMLKGGFSWLLS